MAIVFNNLSGGGSKLYLHYITIGSYTTTLTNTNPTAYTKETLISFLYTNGFNTPMKFYPTSTFLTANYSTLKYTIGIFSEDGKNLKYSYNMISGSITDNNFNFVNGSSYNDSNLYGSISDTVTEL